MEDLLKQISLNVAFGVEGAAALIIVLAALEATWSALRAFWVRPALQQGSRALSDGSREEVRLKLARWLALALEFELAADIVRTAVAPTWDEIGKLAAIAALRTLLNYFLQREIRENEARADSASENKSRAA